MPRAIWTGSLSFGLVNVPVGLFSATDDKAIHFNQFQAGTSDRIRQKRVNERTGEEVEYADVVKGYDLGGGEYVIVTPEELESVEPGRSRTIEITDFVDLDAIDPIYYKSTYYLGPQGDQAVRPYALLPRGDGAEQQGGGRLSRAAHQGAPGHDQAHAVGAGPRDHVLRRRDPRPDEGDPERARRGRLLGPGAEHGQAPHRVDGERLGPGLYEDEYRKRVEGLIDEKRQGKVIVTERPETQPTKVVDLMEALQASVEAARSHRPGGHIAIARLRGQGREHAVVNRAAAGAAAPAETCRA